MNASVCASPVATLAPPSIARERTITYRGLVYPWHCDHMGHMNVMWYTGKFDEASWQFLATLGITATVLRESGRRMAAVEQILRYKQELFAGDAVAITSRLTDVGDKSIHFTHEMFKDDSMEPAATAELVGVHLDGATRRATPFPAEVRERLLRALRR